MFFRGHAVENLIREKSYEDVIHLLIWGHLPNSDQAIRFRRSLSQTTALPQDVLKVIQSFSSVFLSLF
jgi:citrate synthase